jgi:hypothetical protein
MMTGLFGSSVFAAQIRAAKLNEAMRKDQAALHESEMQKVQQLAYDAERYPHFIDLPTHAEV